MIAAYVLAPAISRDNNCSYTHEELWVNGFMAWDC